MWWAVTSQLIRKLTKVLKEGADFTNNVITSPSIGTKTIVQLDHCAFHTLLIKKILLKKSFGSNDISPVNTDDVDSQKNALEEMAVQTIPTPDLMHLSHCGKVQLRCKANGNKHTRIISEHLTQD